MPHLRTVQLGAVASLTGAEQTDGKRGGRQEHVWMQRLSCLALESTWLSFRESGVAKTILGWLRPVWTWHGVLLLGRDFGARTQVLDAHVYV